MTGEEVRRLFGSNLRRLRLQKGLSQLALATQAGMAHNFINDIENGRKWVSPETIAKIVSTLGAEPYQLFLSEELAKDETEVELLAYKNDLTAALTMAMEEVGARYLAAAKQKPELR